MFRIPHSALCILTLLFPVVTASEAQERKPAAKAITPKGTLLRREAPDKPWQLVDQNETLHSGDLILGMAGASLDSLNGAVRLTFRSDLGGVTPLPIVETAVILHEPKEADLDCTLDRGRVEYSSRKEKGTAKVRSRVRIKAGDISLDPGSVVTLEILGYWAPGARFKKDAKPEEGPALSAIFLVHKGEATLQLDRNHFAMKAPPGLAFIEHDSVTGADPSPTRLEELPKWATDDDKSETALKKKAMLAEMRELVLKKSIGDGIDEFLASDDPAKRRLAIFFMAALDDLPRLGLAWANAKQPDVWENAILALRHWIARYPGQDQKLYDGLIQKVKFTPADANTVLQLLHTYSPAETQQPELYELLIRLLSHERPAIRCLAYWHLYRLAPAGRDLKYDPMAAKDKREPAVEAWKKLIPAGELPPKKT